MSDEKYGYEVSDEELKVAFSGPAPGINKFFASLGPNGVRLAFCEESPAGTLEFRNAVCMHPADAIKLKRMLEGLLAGVQVHVDPSKETEDLDGAVDG